MVLMLIAIPLITFITSLIYGIKNKFNGLYPFVIALLFIPTIYIYYNHTAAIYIIIYGVIALIGNFIGDLIKKFDKKTKSS